MQRAYVIDEQDREQALLLRAECLLGDVCLKSKYCLFIVS